MVRPLPYRLAMKSFTALIGVLVASATAHADPLVVAAVPAETLVAPGLVPVAPESSPAPRMFVAAGGAFGGDRGGLYLDPSLEVGGSLGDSNTLLGPAK